MLVISRKCSSAVVAAATHSFPSSLPTTTTSSTSSKSSSTSSSRRPRAAGTRPSHHLPVRRVRRYATYTGYESSAGRDGGRDGGSNGGRDGASGEHTWPDTPTGHLNPTPYQIFDMKHNDKYSKAGYYRLVKLYHPDRHVHSVGATRAPSASAAISHAAMVERYRLIVAAHTILSDPVKRSAYDRFGAGWNGKAEVGGGRDSSWPPPTPSPFHPQSSCYDPADPVWQNATWEDWERYYDHKADPTKRAPVYMRNSYFVAVVVALAIIGTSFNVQRAQDNGQYVIEARDLVHDRASKNLRQLKQEVQGLTSRQDRIDFFIRQREAALGGSVSDYQALREERADRLLRGREVCASEDMKEHRT